MIEISEKSLSELLDKSESLIEKTNRIHILNMIDIESLSKWKQFFGDIFDEDIVRAYNDVVAQYSNPGRYYHNLNHIMACLNEVDFAYIENYESRAILTWAIWFHDIVYDVNSKTNERDSANLAVRWAKEVGVERIGKRAAEIILLTDHKGGRDIDLEGEYLLDIDLSILGKSKFEFAIYDAQIRAEYAHVPDEIYYPARKEILERFFDRKNIYYTDEFRDKYEINAIDNLHRAIKSYANRS